MLIYNLSLHSNSMFFSILEDFEDKVLDLSDYNEDETKAFLADIAEVRPIDIELLKGQISLADGKQEIESDKKPNEKPDANTKKRKNSSQGNTIKFDIRLIFMFLVEQPVAKKLCSQTKSSPLYLKTTSVKDFQRLMLVNGSDKQLKVNQDCVEIIFDNPQLWIEVDFNTVCRHDFAIAASLLPQKWIDGDGIDEILTHVLQTEKLSHICIVPNWLPSMNHVLSDNLPSNRSTATVFLHACNIRNNHWIAFVYYKERKSLIIFDSMDNGSSIDKYLKEIILFVWMLNTILKVSVPWDVVDKVTHKGPNKSTRSNTDLFR